MEIEIDLVIWNKVENEIINFSSPCIFWNFFKVLSIDELQFKRKQVFQTNC